MKIDRRVLESVDNCLNKKGQASIKNQLVKLLSNFIENNYQRDDIINVIEDIQLNETAVNEEDGN